MTLIATVWTRDAIVVASDRRMMASGVVPTETGLVPVFGTFFSDQWQKTYPLPNHCSVSITGGLSGRDMTFGNIVEYLSANRIDENTELEELPEIFGSFMRDEGIEYDASLIFCGLLREGARLRPTVICYTAEDGTTELISGNGAGVRFFGATAAVDRLFGEVKIRRGEETERKGKLMFPAEYYGVGDAERLARFAIRLVHDEARFRANPVTVSEEADVLILRARGEEWSSDAARR